ncbi:MAG TPA: amidohydrolase family protein [Aggregatilineales bacterium]|nr:amidohydrolase family protein [Anaerolineales bacterium]HRE48368.1 amidohydrolase family protein [Aggregatilineales bacterium]
MITTLLNARLVTPDGAMLTTLRFGGRILAWDVRPQRGDAVIDAGGCFVFPGVINAHDHLELNHYPRTKFREMYPNASQWGDEFLPRLKDEPFRTLRRLPLAEQCRIGVLKNLRAGVTTIAHHNPLHRPLRWRYGRVVVQRYGWAHSLHMTPSEDIRARYRATPADAPFMIHLAEGTDDQAAGEWARLDVCGAAGAKTVIVHGVGLSEVDRAASIERGVGLVWCPSTNHYLLGATARVEAFAAAGLLAVGSDSRLTADGDLLDELRAAAATGQVTANALFRAVTVDAARLLRLPDRGSLLPGCRADVVIAAAGEGDPFAALLGLSPAGIQAVYIGGRRVTLES